MTYGDAISKAQVEILEANPKAFLFGIGVGDGAKEVFGTTREAKRRFPLRVHDTPCSEGALAGVALGASIAGYLPIFISARHDFLFYSFDQLSNHIGIWEATFGQKTPMTIRAIVGSGWGNGPQHTKDLTGMFVQMPGIRVRLSNSVQSAYDNLIEASTSGKPTIVVEYRNLFPVSQEFCFSNNEPRYQEERSSAPF